MCTIRPTCPKPAAKPNKQDWRVSDAEKEKLTKMAIQVIKKGLKENPDAQKKGTPFLPREWSKDFKPVLGPYRKFLEKCDAFVLKPGDIPSLYTVHVRGDDSEGAKKTPVKAEWEMKLIKSWEEYKHNVKKADRKPEEFIAEARLVSGADNKHVEGSGKRAARKKRKKIAQQEAEEPPKKKAKKSAREEDEPPTEQGKKKKKKKASA